MRNPFKENIKFYQKLLLRKDNNPYSQKRFKDSKMVVNQTHLILP